MPPFVQRRGTGTAPNYTNASRGMPTDTTLQSLFEGLGTIVAGAGELSQDIAEREADEGVQEAVTLTREERNQSLKERLEGAGYEVNEEKNPDTSSVPVTPGIAESAGLFGGPPSGFQRASVSPEGAQPKEVERTMGEVERLSKARDKGVISETQYWMKLNSRIKKLKARFPSQADRIDRQVQALTGAIPANMIAASLEKEYRERLAATAEAQSDQRRFIEDNIEWLYGVDTQNKSFGELYGIVARRKQKENQMDMEKAELDLRAKRGDLRKEEAIGVAQRHGYELVKSIVDQAVPNSEHTFREMIKKAGADGKFTPEEKQELRLAFNQLRTRAAERLNALLNEPFPGSEDGNSFTSLINDPNKTKQIREETLSILNNVQEQLENEEYGLLTRTVRNIKAQQNEARERFATNELLMNTKVLRDNLGADTVAKLEAGSEGTSFDLTGAAKDFIEGNTFAKGTPLREEFAKELSKLDDNASKAEVTEAVVRDSISVLTDEDAPRKLVFNVVNSLFGEGNREFIKDFEPEDRKEVFHTLTSPQTTKRISELSNSNPELWQKYKDWSFRNAVALFREEAGAVNEGIVERPSISISFNPDTNQFEVEDTSGRIENFAEKDEGFNPIKDLVAAGLQELEQGYATSVREKVESLNRILRTVEPILIEDGKDSTEQIVKLIQSMGINVNAEENPGLLTDMREQGIGPAIINAVTEAFTGEEEGKETGNSPTEKKKEPKPKDSLVDAQGNEVTSREDFFSDTAQEPEVSPSLFDNLQNASYRPEDTVTSDPAFVEGSLEEVEVSGNDVLLDTIKEAETPGDSYNRIFGTTKTFDLENKTIAEVRELQNKMLANGSPSSAVGAYQFLRDTLADAQRALGISDDTLFTKEVQDKLAISLLKRRGLDAYLAGDITEDQFMDRLAKEWAALPTADGTSYYAGDGLNKAQIGREKLREAVRALKKESPEANPEAS